MKLTPINFDPFDNPARRIARAEGGMALQRTAPFPDAPEGYEFYAPTDESVKEKDYIPGVGSEGVLPYAPDAPENATPGVLSKIGTGLYQGMADYLATPHDVMSGPQQAQPEVPGQWSEEDQYRQNLAQAMQSQKETDFGGATALNLFGTSAPFVPKGSVGVAGGRPPTAIGNEGLDYLLGPQSQVGVIGRERGTINPNGVSVLKVADAPAGYESSRLVYSKDGQIVGAMQVTKTPTGQPTIANTYVHPEFRRQGIATDLNKKAEELYGKNLPRSEEPSPAGDAFRQSLKPKEPAKPFYSAVERAIAETPQPKASGEQWAATLRNRPGVKPEEMEWTGLDDWLKEQKGPVTKQQVADYVRDNQVQVQEVTKGGPPNDYDAVVERARTNPDLLRSQLNDVAKQIGMPENSPWINQQIEAVQSGDHFATSKVAKTLQDYADTSSPKFSSYTLPGGSNYRELLLTLPPNNKLEGWKVRPNPHVDGEFEVVDPSGRVRYGTTDAADAQKYLQDEANLVGKQTDFKSSHFDEPNVLAHIRFNDRTIDGKKTLFVEEVQSDWHQKGKREGYAQSVDTTGWTASQTENKSWWNIYDKDGNRVGTTPRAENAAAAIADVAGRDRFQKGVPDAPFKTTWPELAMKRIIRYAAENGYDKVAWTPGEVQAKRYDLSHQIDSLAYRPDGKGTYEVSAIKDGNSVLTKSYQTPEQLEEIVGKDIAKKIVDGEGKTPADFRKNGGVKELSGLDLKVGGEGMKGFYDQILPAAVNKLVKKHGVKVQQEAIPIRRAGLKKSNAEILEQVGMTQDEWNGLTTGQRADLLTKSNNAQPVHSLDITPSLRKSAMEQGFPQFASGGAVKVTKASVDYSKGMPERHCGICEFYRDATCSKVQGTIAPDMWCELFKKDGKASGGKVVSMDTGANLTPVDHNPFVPKPVKPVVEAKKPIQFLPPPKPKKIIERAAGGVVIAPNFDHARSVAQQLLRASGGKVETMPDTDPEKPSLLEQAQYDYPVLKNYDIGFKNDVGGGPGYMESYPPGEVGSPESPRPKEFPINQFGVANYRADSKPSDVMADIASHHLVNADPTIRQTYQEFTKSLEPWQDDILKDQYQHARQSEGETRPYEVWKNASGLPAYFRGYTFQQWPDEFNQRAYTPKQKQMLDDAMKYMQSGREGFAKGGSVSNEPTVMEQLLGKMIEVLQEQKKEFANLAVAVAAPKKLVRDENNNITGSETVLPKEEPKSNLNIVVEKE